MGQQTHLACGALQQVWCSAQMGHRTISSNQKGTTFASAAVPGSGKDNFWGGALRPPPPRDRRLLCHTYPAKSDTILTVDRGVCLVIPTWMFCAFQLRCRPRRGRWWRRRRRPLPPCRCVRLPAFCCTPSSRFQSSTKDLERKDKTCCALYARRVVSLYDPQSTPSTSTHTHTKVSSCVCSNSSTCHRDCKWVSTPFACGMS